VATLDRLDEETVGTAMSPSKSLRDGRERKCQRLLCPRGPQGAAWNGVHCARLQFHQRVSKAVGKPVKVIWTREDDIKGAYYRPASAHAVSAALDAAGKPAAWTHRLVCQPVLIGSAFAGEEERNGIDSAAYAGSGVGFYGIPNLWTQVHTIMRGPKCWAFRSVGSTHNAFVTETFIDELAQAAGEDPVAYRRSMLDAQPRYKAVLELAAEKSGWGRKSPLVAQLYIDTTAM
jgi:isoquinoline 1-oxidoreductase beta subunit